MSCPGGNDGTPRRSPQQRCRRRLPLTIAEVEYPDDLLDPVQFLPQSPERRDILSESPLPSNLPYPLLPPPIPREQLQLMPPLLVQGNWGDYDIDAEQMDDPNISFGEADIAAAAPCPVAAETINRNWEELQTREIPGGAIMDEEGAFLMDISRSSAGSAALQEASMLEDEGQIPQHYNTDSSGLSDRSMGSFVIGLRERLRDPASRFRRLQSMRERRLARQSTPEREVETFEMAARVPCQQIENEMIDFPDLPESPPPTPPMSPRTQAQACAAERRLQELRDDPRNYYDYNPCPDNPRRRAVPLPPLAMNTTAENLDDISFGHPPSPTRGILITSPDLNPRLEEEIRTGARSRIQALMCGGANDLPPRPRMGDLAQLETPDEVEVLVTPEEEERLRAAARIRAHFVCYPTPAIPADAPNIEQDCSLELNDDSMPPLPPPPRSPHHRYSFSSPREPCDARANRSLPRSHTFGPINPMHMREEHLQEESFELLDRSLITESERGYIDQTLPPRPQMYPCDRRRSAGFTPTRAPQRRRLSMPRMDYEEPPEPIPPEFLGAVGPLVFPEMPCENPANSSMIDDQILDYNNILDVCEDEGTQDTVQVQAPNKSPWKIQIKLMAPTSGSSSEPQPGPSGIRPPGRAGPSGIRPPGRLPQPQSRQGGPSSVAGPSGIRRPASSGLRAPSGIRPPGSSPPCPPAPCPPPPCPPAPCPPSSSGVRAPSQSGLRAPSQVLSRAASQTSIRAPNQSNICPLSQTGMRAPGTRRSQTQAQPPRTSSRPQGGAVPRSTGAVPRSTGAVPRSTGAIPRTRPCPPSGQSAAQASSQTRLQCPSQSRMRLPNRRC